MRGSLGLIVFLLVLVLVFVIPWAVVFLPGILREKERERYRKEQTWLKNVRVWTHRVSGRETYQPRLQNGELLWRMQGAYGRYSKWCTQEWRNTAKRMGWDSSPERYRSLRRAAKKAIRAEGEWRQLENED